MLTVFPRTLLFLSSYLPVFLVFTILAWPVYGYPAIAPTVAGLAGVFGIALARWYAKTNQPQNLVVGTVARKDQEALAYLVTYVLPFLDLKLTEPGWIASMVILFIAVLAIFVNAGMIHINPTLSILGYHVFEVTTPQGTPHIVIVRRRHLARGEKLRVAQLAEDVEWVVK
jgi:hypothetical protein